MGLGGGPRENAARGDARARRNRVDACGEAEGETVGGQIGISCGSCEGEQIALVHRLVAYRVEHRGRVDLSDVDDERRLHAQVGNAIIGDLDGDGRRSAAVGFSWCPGDQAERTNGETGRTAHERVGQQVRRNVVGIRRERAQIEREEHVLAGALVRDGRPNGRGIDLGDADREGLLHGVRAIGEANGDRRRGAAVGLPWSPLHQAARAHRERGRAGNLGEREALGGKVGVRAVELQAEGHPLGGVLRAGVDQGRSLVHLVHSDRDLLLVAQGGGAVVGDHDLEGVGAGPLRLGGSPREDAACRDARAGRNRVDAGGEAERQSVRRVVVVRGGSSESEQIALVDRLIADRVEDRGLVDLVHGDRDLLLVAQPRRTVVGDHDLEGVGPWALRLAGSPREGAACRHARAGRNRVDACGEAEGEAVGGQIGIGCGSSEGEQIALVDRLIADRVEDGGLVDLVHSDLEGLGIAQRGRAVVFDLDRDRVHPRPIRLGRAPGNRAARRDRQPGGAGDLREGQGLARVRISGDGGFAVRISFVEGRIGGHGEGGGGIRCSEDAHPHATECRIGRSTD